MAPIGSCDSQFSIGAESIIQIRDRFKFDKNVLKIERKKNTIVM